MDMTSITAAIASLKGAAELAKTFMDLQASVESRSKVIELQSLILAAQGSAFEANAALMAGETELREMREQLSALRAWEVQKRRYVLISPFLGSAVYSLKESASAGEPPHWICPQCYENGVRSILQHRERAQGSRFSNFVCNRCGLTVDAQRTIGTPISFPPEPV